MIDKLDKQLSEVQERVDKFGVDKFDGDNQFVGCAEKMNDFKKRLHDGDSAVSCQALVMLLSNPKLREPGRSQLRVLLDQVMPNFEDKEDHKAHICPPELLEEARSVASSFGAVTVEQPDVVASESKDGDKAAKGPTGKGKDATSPSKKAANGKTKTEKEDRTGTNLLSQRSQRRRRRVGKGARVAARARGQRWTMRIEDPEQGQGCKDGNKTAQVDKWARGSRTSRALACWISHCLITRWRCPTDIVIDQSVHHVHGLHQSFHHHELTLVA